MNELYGIPIHPSIRKVKTTMTFEEAVDHYNRALAHGRYDPFMAILQKIADLDARLEEIAPYGNWDGR